MGVNSLPKTVTRQRRDCNLNPSCSPRIVARRGIYSGGWRQGS